MKLHCGPAAADVPTDAQGSVLQSSIFTPRLGEDTPGRSGAVLRSREPTWKSAEYRGVAYLILSGVVDPTTNRRSVFRGHRRSLADSKE